MLRKKYSLNIKELRVRIIRNLRVRAIDYALAKRMAERVPFRDDSSINYVALHVEANDASDDRLIITKRDGEVVHSLAWDGRSYCRPCCLRLEDALSSRIRPVYAYRDFWTTYNDLDSFIIGIATGRQQVLYWVQKIYARAAPALIRFRASRMDALNAAVKEAMHSDSFPAGDEVALEVVFKRLYGNRAFYHPRHSVEYFKLNFILQSFVQSGELDGVNYKYKVLPKALETLDRYAVEERRHRLATRQMWTYLLLTAIIASIALFNAVIN